MGRLFFLSLRQGGAKGRPGAASSGLAAAILVAGCKTSPLAEQCRTLAGTVNRRLDAIEAVYTARPPQKADWNEIAQAYASLHHQLGSMKFEDPRLVQATTDYQAAVALAAQTTRSVAAAVKRRKRGEVRQHLEELRAQADQHRRISQRIDRLCHAR